jgi:tetratricopeptide (TPR) repeat protein
MSVDIKQRTAEAQALKAAGNIEPAISAYRQIVALAPKSGVAEHNLAGALGDAGRWREAERHIRQAFSKGIDAPESWLVLARCLQALGRFDEAEQTFRQALRRRPTFPEAHNDLAQLRWMRSGEVDDALAELDAVLDAIPDTRLAVVKAQVLEHIGRVEESRGLLATLAAAHPDDVVVVTAASQIAATTGDAAEALRLAERAAAVAGGEQVVAIALISACLAAGEAERAAALAEKMRQWAPNNQHAIALQATAWRLLGDARYRILYDYDRLVGVSQIDTPQGWADLDAYIADLAKGLHAAHAFRTHPFAQSVRHGSQVPDILQHDHKAIAALPQALEGPIRRHIQALGQGNDPVRARNTGDFAYQGVWSIRLRAAGFHVDHVHPNGWLSSACYIEVPPALRGQEGWLKFGQPGVRTTPALDAEHFVEPAPGKLALFPSYMWHGTVPFADDATRMTVAFDLVPN